MVFYHFETNNCNIRNALLLIKYRFIVVEGETNLTEKDSQKEEINLTVVVFLLVFSGRNVDFGDLLSPEIRAKHKFTTYDLISNIVHEGEPGAGQGSYKVHILHKVSTSV